MRYALLTLLSLVAVAAADPPKNRQVKVNEIFILEVKTDDPVVKLAVERPGIEIVDWKKNPDSKNLIVRVKGVAVGQAELLADAIAYYSYTFDVLPADALPPPPPADTSIQIVPLKRVPVEIPPAVVPPPEPPAKAATPKKVGAVTRPTRPPLLAYQPATASAPITRATNAPRAVVPNSSGIATSATFPASSPATIRIAAPTTGQSGITMKAADSGCQTASG